MSNIEDDIKILTEENSSYKKEQAMQNILSEREQDKARIKELEEENMQEDLEKIGIEENIKADMKEIIERYYTANEECIPKQKVKDVLQNNRNEIFSFTYVDDEQFKPYTMQIDRINKIEKELLEEGK